MFKIGQVLILYPIQCTKTMGGSFASWLTNSIKIKLNFKKWKIVSSSFVDLLYLNQLCSLCVQTLTKAFCVVRLCQASTSSSGPKTRKERAIEDSRQLLKVFEEGIEKDFPGQSPFFNGEILGYLGIVIGSLACNYQAVDEAIGVVLISEKNQKFLSWVNALENYPLLEETLPPHDKLVARLSVWLKSTQF